MSIDPVSAIRGSLLEIFRAIELAKQSAARKGAATHAEPRLDPSEVAVPARLAAASRLGPALRQPPPKSGAGSRASGSNAPTPTTDAWRPELSVAPPLPERHGRDVPTPPARTSLPGRSQRQYSSRGRGACRSICLRASHCSPRPRLTSPHRCSEANYWIV